ncbi:MAG: hypothetical protein IKA10_04405, partial [Oscillospiraceae bacterium]|nr:hypothetical protein [Oscillospiraceae bacterium]
MNSNNFCLTMFLKASDYSDAFLFCIFYLKVKKYGKKTAFRFSGLRTRKHKHSVQHKKAVTALSTLALHKVVLRISALQQHFLCVNVQKCPH